MPLAVDPVGATEVTATSLIAFTTGGGCSSFCASVTIDLRLNARIKVGSGPTAIGTQEQIE